MDPRRHRHFVALPLAAGALLLVFGTHAFLAGTLHTGADTVALVTEDTEQTVDIGSLLTVHLQPQTNARADRTGMYVVLEEGELTVRSHGYVKVDLGQGVSAHVLGGAASFLAGATSTTVVALSSPIVFESTKGRLLLATGHQLIVTPSSVTRSVVPSEWTLARLESVSSKNSIADSTEDPSEQLAVLLHADTAASSEDIALLQATLAQVSGRTDLSSLIALSLLASGRPIAKDGVPALQVALVSSEDVRLGVPLALVQIARSLGSPLPETLIAFWSSELVRAASTDIALALDTLAFGADASVRFAALGYPISSQEWSNAVASVSPILRSIAKSDDQKRELATIETGLNATKRPVLLASLEPVKVEKNPHTDEPVSTLPPEQLIGDTWAMFLRRGALIGGETRVAIDPAHPSLVRIFGLFREEQGTLVSYDLSYDLKTDTFLNIERAGVAKPNAMEAADFLR